MRLLHRNRHRIVLIRHAVADLNLERQDSDCTWGDIGRHERGAGRVRIVQRHRAASSLRPAVRKRVTVGIKADRVQRDHRVFDHCLIDAGVRRRRRVDGWRRRR